MFLDLTKISIFVRPGSTDMRSQINGLSVLAESEMKLDSGSGSLFLFCSKNRKNLKCIYWDKNGFAMWQKKLEKDKFPWPQTADDAEEITLEQLKLLLSGIDFWKAHKEIYFKEMN
ncbi:transposase [Thiospirochaeta perfilievii]|uniref:Transposase n=1 Tax=Thiospirochaeta perfilievii TaxID=252967 RepID=A0A5C1QD70_9SPIO|nr:IS66 family insertion sequence element accessory protein TnpB [Thiospirochaeta perfilievii]QEN03564.1 transposase [Thiospirochaeta perfilievii]QEN04140.1 transposase [Thiospirochaeta perfilievii]QEN04152.1 transposase [Thiospirochaeta perfilievii]QEN04563.1 transposase [Thiospirochaeta perfilievii]QEN04759.1 transposase [Thiospirochaeta perfilievii]